MNSNLAKKTFSGFLWLGGVKATNAILQFGILAILARLLTPTEFGLMGLALIVIGFSDIFIDMGFGPAITQKKELSKTDIYTGFTSSLFFGGFLFITIWILASTIASFFNSHELIQILKVISFILLLRSMTTIPLGLMYREMKYRKLSLIQIFSYAFGYGGVGVTLAYLGYGVWSLVLAVLSQTILSLTLYLYIGRKSLGFALNRKSFFSLLHFGGGYSLSKVFSYGANKGDKILVGRLLGVDALGLYERGYQLVKYIGGLLGEIIDKVLFSPIARKQEDRSLVGKVYIEITYVIAIVFFPLTGFIYCNAEHIVRIVLGNQWDSTIGIVQIMSPAVFFLICTRVGSTVAKSLGDVYRRAWRTLFYAIYIIVAVYISSRWGIEGVALAVTIGTVINYLIVFGQVHLLTKVKYMKFIEGHGIGIGLMITYFLFYFFVEKIFIDKLESHFIQLIVGGLILLIVYGIGYLIDYKGIVKNYYKKILK